MPYGSGTARRIVRLDVDRGCSVRPVPGDRVAARVGRVRDVEPAVARVPGVEGEAEQALLAAEGDLVADVEEDGSAPAAQAKDAAGLLDDVDGSGLAGGVGQEHRLLEPAGVHRLAKHGLRPLCRACQRRDEDTENHDDADAHVGHGSRRL